MPIYVYRNLVTGETFEIEQRMTEDALTVHPETGDPVKRLIQPVGIAFKGSGFYVNDSRRSGGARSSSSGSSDSGSGKGDSGGSAAEKGGSSGSASEKASSDASGSSSKEAASSSSSSASSGVA